MNRILVLVLALLWCLHFGCRAHGQCSNGRCSSPTRWAPASSTKSPCGCPSGCACSIHYGNPAFCADPANCPGGPYWHLTGSPAYENSESLQGSSREARRFSKFRFFRRGRFR